MDTLKRVIRSGGESITDFYERLIQPGLSSFHSAREDFEEMIGRLIKRGRLDPEEGKNLIEEIKNGTAQMQKRLDGPWNQLVDLVRGFSLLGGQVAELERQVEQLEKQIEELKDKGVIKH